jgi:hypothetical protein
MVIIQRIDRERNLQKHTLYQGSGLNRLPKAYYQGGNGLLDFVKDGISLLSDNKELIQSGISTAGKVFDLGKSISDVAKTKTELELVKQSRLKNKEKKVDDEMTPEMEEKMRKLTPRSGSGFTTVIKQPCEK